MFINNQLFETDLANMNNIRYLFFIHLYCNSKCIKSLTDIITKHIECLSIDYSQTTYTFTIKIKKTVMRKIHGFKQDPNFYYLSIPNIFMDFIKANEQDVLSALSERYDNPYTVLDNLYSNPRLMANLCHVSCIADNIVYIKL